MLVLVNLHYTQNTAEAQSIFTTFSGILSWTRIWLKCKMKRHRTPQFLQSIVGDECHNLNLMAICSVVDILFKTTKVKLIVSLEVKSGDWSSGDQECLYECLWLSFLQMLAFIVWMSILNIMAISQQTVISVATSLTKLKRERLLINWKRFS